MRRVETGPRLIFFTRLALKHPLLGRPDKLDVEATATAFEKVHEDKTKKKAGERRRRRRRRSSAHGHDHPRDGCAGSRRPALFSGCSGCCVFVVALYLSFPSERAKEVAIRIGGQHATSTSRSARPARRSGWAVDLPRHPVRTQPGDRKADPLHDRLGAALGLPLVAAARRRRPSPSRWRRSAGTIEHHPDGRARARRGRSSSRSARATSTLGELPGVREPINLPLTGDGRSSISTLASETGKLRRGQRRDHPLLRRTACSATARRRSRWRATRSWRGGLTLPRVRLDDFGGHVAIDKGLAKLQEIEAKSPDGEVALEGEVTLRDPLPTSTVNAYLRFKLTDAFLKQAGAVQTILQMAGAQGKRPDGFYGDAALAGGSAR